MTHLYNFVEPIAPANMHMGVSQPHPIGSLYSNSMSPWVSMVLLKQAIRQVQVLHRPDTPYFTLGCTLIGWPEQN